MVPAATQHKSYAAEPDRRISLTCGSRRATVIPCWARRCGWYEKPVAISAVSNDEVAEAAITLPLQPAPWPEVAEYVSDNAGICTAPASS